MTFLITFSALENAIGRSAEGGHSVASNALLAESLPGMSECPWIHCMMMCTWMVFSSIGTPSTRAFRPDRVSHKDLLSVQISMVLLMLGL